MDGAGALLAFVRLRPDHELLPDGAHNGYLDVINDLGYIGLFLLLGYLIVYIRQSLRLLQIDYAQATLYLALMFQQLLTNLSESHWFILSDDFVILTFATFGARADPGRCGARPAPTPVTAFTALRVP